MDNDREIVEKVKNNLIKQLEYIEDVGDDELHQMIGKELRELGKEYHISIKDRMNIGKRIFDSMRKLDILQDFLEDGEVSEVMINGVESIFYEKKGRLYKSTKNFLSEEVLGNVIQQIVAKCNRVVNESSPIVDARLSDGSRVNVVLNPVAINGPILTIRRFPKKPYRMEDLIRIGSINTEAAEFLKKLVIAGYNIIISGGTGSGKTTFLNALSANIPKDERIITIEDSAELQIQGIENLVRMETKNSNLGGNMPITIRDLIKSSLRMRPDRIIVGEVRGGEAMDMICSAMNCGHDGSMSTVHANSAADSISRLETMILMAVNLPLHSIRRQIGSGVDIIVHLGRLRDRSRRVLEIVELNQGSENIHVNTIYKFMEDNGALGIRDNSLETNCIFKENSESVRGRLVKTGELINAYKLSAAGLKI